MAPVSAAFCLDITRLVSRQGRGALTGIDRVELAYLRFLSAATPPLYCLAHTRFGALLIGPDQSASLLAAFEGQNWGALDLIGRVRRKAPVLMMRAEAHLRRIARARAAPLGLGPMLARHLPPGSVYVNVGHSALTAERLSAWRRVPDAQVAVLIHDTIPLDHPEFARPGTPARFEAMLRAVSAHADCVIFSTESAAKAAEPWLARFGRTPPRVIAALGVTAEAPDPSAIPKDLVLPKPYFMTLGTIEPRKNHALLLDVWAGFDPGTAPTLLIAGQRGWANEHVFSRLDQVGTGPIIERADLSDAALAALLQSATGALFPSLAEGFGLPVLEAALHGAPIICSDLPVTQGLLGNIPVYANPRDVYDWQNKIRNLVAVGRAAHPTPPLFTAPTWDDHFNQVLKVLCQEHR